MHTWRADAAGLPAAMWTSGALLVLGGAVALLLPSLPYCGKGRHRVGTLHLEGQISNPGGDRPQAGRAG